MRYQLHYASLELTGDIPCINLENQEELIYQLNGHSEDPLPHERLIPWVKTPFFGRINKREESIVYLCSIETPPSEDGVILVDSKPENILAFVSSHTNTPTLKKIFLQEYSSYEEAYKVALNIKEVNPLCFSPETLNQMVDDL
jgi:hypothetical protein